MLKCKEISEQASEIVDGNVSGLYKLKIQMHLLMCTHCRSFVQKIKLTKQMVSQLTLTPASDEKVDQIMDSIEEDKKKNLAE